MEKQRIQPVQNVVPEFLWQIITIDIPAENADIVNSKRSEYKRKDF
ncbi:MAG: hypothetical protein PWR30_92 [Candidatus Woesearchaeota archaeon]|nr:hypothetical protein [Candidatus Woesearchaeota archaeon]